MPTATLDTSRIQAPSLRDRAADTVRQVSDAVREVGQLKTLAVDRFEDGVHAAKRTITKTVRDLEDFRDATAGRVRKAPLSSVGAAVGTGLVLGVAIGWLGQRRRQHRELQSRLKP